MVYIIYMVLCLRPLEAMTVDVLDMSKRSRYMDSMVESAISLTINMVYMEVFEYVMIACPGGVGVSVGGTKLGIGRLPNSRWFMTLLLSKKVLDTDLSNLRVSCN